MDNKSLNFSGKLGNRNTRLEIEERKKYVKETIQNNPCSSIAELIKISETESGSIIKTPRYMRDELKSDEFYKFFDVWEHKPRETLIKEEYLRLFIYQRLKSVYVYSKKGIKDNIEKYIKKYIKKDIEKDIENGIKKRIKNRILKRFADNFKASLGYLLINGEWDQFDEDCLDEKPFEERFAFDYKLFWVDDYDWTYSPKNNHALTEEEKTKRRDAKDVCILIDMGETPHIELVTLALRDLFQEYTSEIYCKEKYVYIDSLDCKATVYICNTLIVLSEIETIIDFKVLYDFAHKEVKEWECNEREAKKLEAKQKVLQAKAEKAEREIKEKAGSERTFSIWKSN